MIAMHARLMLKKVDSKKYNLEPTFKEIEELERLARIGKATEKSFKEGYEINSSCVYARKRFKSFEELIRWKESESE